MRDEATTAALRCTAISKRFGGLVANDAIDFDVRAGEIHALVGENGAGKSTLMNILYGMFQPDAGTIEVDGVAVRFASCADAMRAGIGMVFQHYLLVERFSVAENVLLGNELSSRGGFLDPSASQETVRKVASRYRFPIDPAATVESLGVGARQQVELLRVLERNPRIVILDEPTAALAPNEIAGLFGVMRRLRDEGRAVIFITHKLKEVMQLCDRITVLRRGRVVGSLDREHASEDVLAAMMIGTADTPGAKDYHAELPSRRVVLQVSELSVAGDHGSSGISGIDISCKQGEIIGIAGVEGNGQAEFAEAMYGSRPMSAGRIMLDGADVTRAPLLERRRAGLRYISFDRQREGLVLDFDAVENALLGDARSTTRTVGLDLATGRNRADDIAASFHIEPYDRAAPMRSYSGGTQQKFMVGRETAGSPKVIIACAPTRGVDVGAARNIYERLRFAQRAGACVLLVSFDLDEIRELADRIVVFHRGKIAGELMPSQADDMTLGRLMGSGAA